MTDASKATNSDNATPAADDAAATTEEVIVVDTLPGLIAELTEVASTPVEKPARMYNKAGFKGLDGLDGISNETLAIMAAACQRQIAINGGDNVAAILGSEDKQGRFKAGSLALFGPHAVKEAEMERKIGNYIAVANDLKIQRGKGESASDFIARITGELKTRQS